MLIFLWAFLSRPIGPFYLGPFSQATARPKSTLAQLGQHSSDCSKPTSMPRPIAGHLIAWPNKSGLFFSQACQPPLHEGLLAQLQFPSPSSTHARPQQGLSPLATQPFTCMAPCTTSIPLEITHVSHLHQAMALPYSCTSRLHFPMLLTVVCTSRPLTAHLHACMAHTRLLGLCPKNA